MIKKSAFVLVACALTACGPQVPDSGASGVGFDDYQDYRGYRSQRDSELNGTSASAPAGTPGALAASPSNPAPTTVTSSTLPDGDGAAAPTVTLNNPGISDENDFGAVSNRQSIESDAERLRAQREARQVIEPTALPTRTSAGPNIVDYAISTQNPVGQKVYRRSITSTQKKFTRNCAAYASADLAQEDFLRKGGPERDKLGLDPDGDGFACAWDPTPFRRITASNR